MTTINSIADKITIAKQIVDFMAFSEGLKTELRHSWLSDRRQESVAEHSYQMALMAMLSHQYLENPVDITHVLKMILVHDLVEAECGDVPFLDQVNNPVAKEEKVLKEKSAIEKIRQMLPEPINHEIYSLWYEFEERQTSEAKFTKALDDLEVEIQLNLAPFETWGDTKSAHRHTKVGRNCGHDPFLIKMAEVVLDHAEEKMTAGGLDVAALRERALS